jgi:YfiH family protein
MVADCIPLILNSKFAVAAVHVGRKGLVNRVTEKSIEILREFSDHEITATIGPAICGKCYEVSQDIFDEVVKSHPATASQTHLGSPALDLVAGLISDLNELGIHKIANQTRCTFEDEDLFSYRRSTVTGRQAGLVWL